GCAAQLPQVVERCLYGVDVDPSACALTLDAVRRTVECAASVALPGSYFRNNVACADFLGSTAEVPFPLVDGGFQVILGNPPYVSATRIGRDEKSRLRERFAVAGGRLDLYAVFFERAMELLAAGGRLAFITPDKYLASQ